MKIKPLKEEQISTTSNMLKNLLKKSMLSTTVHGLPNIARTNIKSLKIMWLICVVLSTSFGVYFVYKNIFEYLQFDVVTRYEVVYEEQSEFPTVSFCSEVGFKNKSLNEFVMNCSFSGDISCFLNKNSSFEKFEDLTYGECYRFNSGKDNGILKTIYSGNRFGFFIVLNMIPNDNLIISINNHSMVPFTFFNSETYVSSGSQSEFIVSRLFTQNLPEPYNQCYKNVIEYSRNKTFINMILNAKRTYSQRECLEMCTYSYYLENSNCGCDSLIENVPVTCFLKSNDSIKNCTFNFMSQHLQSKIQKICAEYCPVECDSLHFSIEKFSTHSNLNETKLTVYYDSLKYTLVSQQPKTLLIDLIPNIGGILGLFIGTSFLSFFEIIELFVEAFSIMNKREKIDF